MSNLVNTFGRAYLQYAYGVDRLTVSEPPGVMLEANSKCFLLSGNANPDSKEREQSKQREAAEQEQEAAPGVGMHSVTLQLPKQATVHALGITVGGQDTGYVAPLAMAVIADGITHLGTCYSCVCFISLMFILPSLMFMSNSSSLSLRRTYCAFFYLLALTQTSHTE